MTAIRLSPSIRCMTCSGAIAGRVAAFSHPPAQPSPAARGAPNDTELFPQRFRARTPADAATSSRYSWPATPVQSPTTILPQSVRSGASVASSPRTRSIPSPAGSSISLHCRWQACCCCCGCCCRSGDAGLGHRLSESQTGRSVDEAVAVGEEQWRQPRRISEPGEQAGVVVHPRSIR